MIKLNTYNRFMAVVFWLLFIGFVFTLDLRILALMFIFQVDQIIMQLEIISGTWKKEDL